MPDTDSSFRVGLGQIAPVLLDREATLEKICASIRGAASQGCSIVAFGEALLPGYPVWLGSTGGARFDDDVQKEYFRLYHDAAIQVEGADLESVRQLAREHRIAIVLGCIERAKNRGGHSLYCTALYVDQDGETGSAHRKLVPTYEERLVWSPGDGHGLRVHDLGPFTAGVLNCWENWMPLARASLHAQGEDLHFAIWPGSVRNTRDLTPVLAKEGRSFVVSVGAPLRRRDLPDDFPQRDAIAPHDSAWIHDGGSCVAAPDGSWVVEPIVEEEGTFVATLDPPMVARERQNFDPSGHYSRPDVLRLEVNRCRQEACTWIE
ncbi:MAG: carbon-nitrogen hydrolase family protein [Planctomycetes bacterium]|nr:carbon-nitrogen hydrolase family protein [Planctomycetota bacterium]